MINLFVTGHKGYIGSALIKSLDKILFVKDVVGYDLVDGNDIMNYDQLEEAMKKAKPFAVIHLAALSSVAACNEDPRLAIKINSVGTQNVLNAMKTSNCKHIIYAGTSSVYGSKESLPYTEDLQPAPCSSYGISKLLGENVIHNHYDLQENKGSYLIYRMFNVAGTSGYPEIDLASNPGYDRIFSALEAGAITIYGKDYPTFDRTCERDYVALKDVCDAYVKGINIFRRKNIKEDIKEDIRETVNICTGYPCSVQTIVNIWNLTSKSLIHEDSEDFLPEISFTYGDRREGDPATVYGSNMKAKEILNWKPYRKIEDIIRDLAHDKKKRFQHE